MFLNNIYSFNELFLELYCQIVYDVKIENGCDMMNIKERFPALGYQNFRYFIMGQGISLIGTWMQRVAQQWVIYRMTESPVVLGLIGVFQYLPMLIFSLFAGSFIARFPRKKFLIIMQVLQCLQALVLTILIWKGLAKPWHIMFMAGFLGLTNAFDMPARQSFFMELVGKDALPSAIGLNSTIVNLGKIIGPALGGYFLASFGETVCFLFNTLSFLAVIYGLVKISGIKEKPVIKNNDVLRESYEGIKYVYKNKRILAVLSALFIVSTIAMNNEVIIPVFARKVLDLDSKGFSLMYSALGLGSLIGALKNAGRKKAIMDLKIIYFSGIVVGLGLFILAFVNQYYLVLLVLFIMGYAMVMFMNFVNGTVQLSSSEEYRIRAVSIYTLIFTGTTPLGNYMTGHITEKFGVKTTLFLAGFSTMILLVFIGNLFKGVANESKS